MHFTQIRRVASTGSTNDDIAQMLGEPESRGLTLVAEHQTRGKGRKGRSWIAPPGSALTFTTALPEPVLANDLWAVQFWIGLAVYDALNAFGIRTQLQWPNDVLLEGKKVAGILCVSRVAGNEAWVGCGVGIDVARPDPDRVLDEISPAPIFLSDVRSVDRDRLLDAILRAADASYEMLRAPATVVAAWQTAAGIPGARYRIRLDESGEKLEGAAVQLGTAGELILDERGTQRAITQADATVMR